jgi:3-hydroxybutyryl-CoA dehydrogenase
MWGPCYWMDRQGEHGRLLCMQLEEIREIAVIGLGRMGHGIAQSFAMAGYTVRGYDNVDAMRTTALARIRRNLDDFAAQDLLKDDVESILGRITVTGDEASAARGAQFVVEAIVEELDAKVGWFERMEEVVEENTILASNSSTFTISKSGAVMRFPQRAVVTHWFNPPHIVPTVEVVPGPKTIEEVTETTVALHRKIGKLAVRINQEIPGFLVNRVQIALIREVWDLYERGIASPEDIDTAIRGSIGFRLANFGPLAICDFGGVDIWAKVFKNLGPDIRSDTSVPEIIEERIREGHIGSNVGSGIFNYDAKEPEAAEAKRDAWMLQLAKLLQSREAHP